MSENDQEQTGAPKRGTTRDQAPGKERRPEAPMKLPPLFSPDGKPLKVLSTSLGIALLANALYSAGTPNKAAAETDEATASASVSVSTTVSVSTSDDASTSVSVSASDPATTSVTVSTSDPVSTSESVSTSHSASPSASPSASASSSAAPDGSVPSGAEPIKFHSNEPIPADQAEDPVLAEWSSEDVKAYFDPALDWNIPLPGDEEEEDDGAAAGDGTVVSGGGGGTTVIHTSSGFGWDDLMLYHLIMGRGSSYSTGAYYSSHPAYDARSGQSYKPKSYSSESFQNKAVVGSTVRPKTSGSSGSITRRSTSSSSGGIGGKSSGFSSSGSSKSSSGGFGG